MHSTATIVQSSAFILQILVTLTFVWLFWNLWRVIFNLYFHPLSGFPGPHAAAATSWWKTYVEWYKQVSFIDKLVELHAIYGDIVRIGPNELHFSRPSVYHEIYNNKNKWDKDKALYRAFNQDRSSFGLLTYREAKERKDVLSPLFSMTAIVNMQGLVQDKIDALCKALEAQHAVGKSSDILFCFRSFSMDTITSFCFAKSINAIGAPDFKAPVLEALEISHPMRLITYKHFDIVRRMVSSLPTWLTLKVNPQIAGIVRILIMLRKQVSAVMENPKLLEDAPYPIIYHALLNPAAHKGRSLPSEQSLFDEALTMLAAGSDTVGTALMLGVLHTLERPEVLDTLQKELLAAWPNLQEKPRLEHLEKLPYLTAVVKESVRTTPGVVTGLARVVPSSGATICGAFIPAGTVVSQSSQFVLRAESVFPSAEDFVPERWLQPNSKSLEAWLVTFSKGPRSCLGINLAYSELYIALANIFRRFDLRIDSTKPADLKWRECFVPHFSDRHPYAFLTPKFT